MVNIGKYDEGFLLQRAEEIVVAKTQGSRVFDADAESAIPRFQPQGKRWGLLFLETITIFSPWLIFDPSSITLLTNTF